MKKTNFTSDSIEFHRKRNTAKTDMSDDILTNMGQMGLSPNGPVSG